MRMTATCPAIGLMLLAAVALAAQQSRGGDAGKGDVLVYVGTYTGGKTNSQGIYAFRMQARAGQPPAFTPLGLAAETASPSFITVDRARGLLFAVNETSDYQGKPTGSVSAFSIDRATGRLTLINRQPSMGRSPCHLTLDQSGRHLLVANYSSGTVAVLPVAADGQLAAATCVIHHQGSSIRPEQEGPHAHMIRPSVDGHFVLVTDLGIDQVLVYQLDTSTGQLALNQQGRAVVSENPGAGPRHFALAASGRTLYVINELNATVTVYDSTPERGELHARQVVSTLPNGVDGPPIGNSYAHIAVSPDSQFVYGSNRGHDSIA